MSKCLALKRMEMGCVHGTWTSESEDKRVLDKCMTSVNELTNFTDRISHFVYCFTQGV